MNLAELEIRATAIVGGAITNNVKVLGAQGGMSRGRKPPRRRVHDHTGRDQGTPLKLPQPPLKPRKPARVHTRKRRMTKGFYISDKSLDGTGTKVIAISVPKKELDWIDAMATRVQMNRSHFLRAAAKHFGAKIFPDGALK